jgi:hypothetical protein
MNQSRAEEIVARLLSNAAGLKFGAVGLTATIYNGQVTQVIFSTTENLKEKIIQVEGNEWKI